MNLTIIGSGYVGLVTGACLADIGHDVFCLDVDQRKIDVLNNGGRPRQVDTRPFRVGENLAATPGKVVFKNELMELIQYAPQTPKVHAIPVLASPPWINKYYVMDLAPGRSFLEWAVQHERTVFAISYRNRGGATVPHGGGGTGIGNSDGFELTVHPGSLDVTITAPATHGNA